MAAKGVLLHNLTNIRRSKDTWQGSTATQGDPSFISFIADKWSIRATAKLLVLYQRRLGKGVITIPEIINVWAPNTENNTNAYIDNVCLWTGYTPVQELNITTFDPISKIIQAMIRMEVGLINYNMNTIEEGLKLAGIYKDKI